MELYSNPNFFTLENSKLNLIEEGYSFVNFIKNDTNIIQIGVSIVTVPSDVAYCTYTGSYII